MQVIKSAAGKREIVRTGDRVNPFGLRLDGVVVVTSWSQALMERLLEDETFCKAAFVEIDAADSA